MSVFFGDRMVIDIWVDRTVDLCFLVLICFGRLNSSFKLDPGSVIFPCLARQGRLFGKGTEHFLQVYSGKTFASYLSELSSFCQCRFEKTGCKFADKSKIFRHASGFGFCSSSMRQFYESCVRVQGAGFFSPFALFFVLEIALRAFEVLQHLEGSLRVCPRTCGHAAEGRANCFEGRVTRER